ncbi:glycoside hydrolase family 3 protein [Fictibacillus sp. FJAT-27399]|uniref:glycoside hydrolase family 3 protein n=1 Tax=Fictibacillus sp. FJAT-27399 TaxID=1729689 RepID=UPI000785AF26|nr:glycoside hydrolase family 3 protein [Fictibacillus sp. FJAT-27399]
MTSKFIRALFIIMAIMLVFPQSSLAASSPVKKEKDDAWLKRIVKHMTVEEKAGQVFIIHVYGKTAEDPAYEQINIKQKRGAKNFAEAIEKYHLGGVIYFNWTDNIGMPVDKAQVNALSNGIQKAAMKQRIPIPLFVSTDQEGGVVARVTEPGTVFPGNMALAAAQSTDYARQSASIMGLELKSLGINLNFAPDLDVNVNPNNPVIGVRSFSENPDVVARMGVAQVKGYQEQNMMATAKHFPGHGDTDVDSHSGLPIINHDLKTLNKVDLKPFKAAIKSGIDAIMSGHLVVPALDDSGMPATLSKPILTGLLREKMKFKGLIITDSLGMSGANIVPPDRVPVEAFKAGADILLNPPDVDVAYNGLLNAVKSGEISEKRLNQSVIRILKAKIKRGLFRQPLVDPSAINQIGLLENLQKAENMTDRSITLIKNDNHTLPLKEGSKVLVTGPSLGKPAELAAALNEKGIAASGYATSASPTAAELASAVNQASSTDLVVVTAYTANTNSAQQKFVKALQAAGKPVVLASMRNPYDIMTLPDVTSNILTYGNQNVSVRSLAKALVGEINPSGKLPVTIPGKYEFGFGLSY